MANLEVDPGLQLQLYGEKLKEAHSREILATAAVNQLQNQLTQAEDEIETLKAENERLAKTQKTDGASGDPGAALQ